MCKKKQIFSRNLLFSFVEKKFRSSEKKSFSSGFSDRLQVRLPYDDDEEYIDLGAAELSFYAILVELLGRCAPSEETIKMGKPNALRAKSILKSLVSMHDLEGVLGLKFLLPSSCRRKTFFFVFVLPEFLFQTIIRCRRAFSRRTKCRSFCFSNEFTEFPIKKRFSVWSKTLFFRIFEQRLFSTWFDKRKRLELFLRRFCRFRRPSLRVTWL